MIIGFFTWIDWINSFDLKPTGNAIYTWIEKPNPQNKTIPTLMIIC